jgi:hypothetical protein
VGDVRGDGQHLTVDGIALDDLGVVLDTDRCGQVQDELTKEGEAADVLQVAAPVELVRDGDLVDRLVALGEREAGLVSPGVSLAKEVARPQDPQGLEDRLLVHHERGNDRLFSLDIVRW